MFEYLEKSKCRENVSDILHSVGMDKTAAQELTFNYPECFEPMSRLTYQLPRQIFHLIATLVFLEHILTKSRRPHYSIYHYKNNIDAKLLNVTSANVQRERVVQCYRETRKLIGNRVN
ncbi:hypothetical protein L3V77_08560 [Vibrio sp. DW001]|uniref:hypothetical protein n=1 Tax=Vibrio sp. DW001 TaxID=2912315 RepID=UPI0023B13165|nr:hypothetical protein [Vibrio sp. DW001]WED28259.1 hypothetical protein L3V77_08560 [Vibrio sp. DW001]